MTDPPIPLIFHGPFIAQVSRIIPTVSSCSSMSRLRPLLFRRDLSCLQRTARVVGTSVSTASQFRFQSGTPLVRSHYLYGTSVRLSSAQSAPPLDLEQCKDLQCLPCAATVFHLGDVKRSFGLSKGACEPQACLRCPAGSKTLSDAALTCSAMKSIVE